MPQKIDVMTPKRELAISYYLDPESETFSNRTQSFIKAGFSRSYVSGHPKIPWFDDNPIIQDNKLLKKAVENMQEMLDYKAQGGQKLKIKADMTKFVASGVGKGRFAPRVESVNLNISTKKELDSDQLANIAGLILDKKEQEPPKLEHKDAIDVNGKVV